MVLLEDSEDEDNYGDVPPEPEFEQEEESTNQGDQEVGGAVVPQLGEPVAHHISETSEPLEEVVSVPATEEQASQQVNCCIFVFYWYCRTTYLFKTLSFLKIDGAV